MGGFIIPSIYTDLNNVYIYILTVLQRLIYYIQAPLTLVAGAVIFLAIPDQAKKATHEEEEEEEHTFRQKLGRIDYMGILTLVSIDTLEDALIPPH
jgi:hypothetical protein